MVLPELRASIEARVKGRLDGVPALLSYLFFTSVQRHAPNVARGAERFGRRLRGLCWLVGEVETNHGSVVVAYLGTADRLSRWLLDRLGVKSPRRVEAPLAPGGVPAAVEIVAVPVEERRDWARAGWLVLPRYVHHRQPLGREPSSFERRVAERIRTNGVALRMSQHARDLERFQQELYDPMLARRHGDRALRTGRALLRHGQRRGGLLIAEVAKRPIAAAIGAPARSGSELEIWALGVAADASAGLALAPVFGWVQWARERRFTSVDHLVSLPLYSDGLTRQKLRWGTELSAPTESHEMVALRLNDDGPAVQSWIRGHTFAACSSTGIVPVDISTPDALPELAKALV